jgi:hypothetical protein
MFLHNELSKMRIAIVHPWFITEGGGERVIDAIAGVCPRADIFTLILDRSTLSANLRHRNIQASFLSSIPKGGRFYQHLMPLYHLATASFDLSGYDLVISSGGPATKGVIVGQGARHIHYSRCGKNDCRRRCVLFSLSTPTTVENGTSTPRNA